MVSPSLLPLPSFSLPLSVWLSVFALSETQESMEKHVPGGLLTPAVRFALSKLGMTNKDSASATQCDPTNLANSAAVWMDRERGCKDLL